MGLAQSQPITLWAPSQGIGYSTQFIFIILPSSRTKTGTGTAKLLDKFELAVLRSGGFKEPFSSDVPNKDKKAKHEGVDSRRTGQRSGSPCVVECSRVG